MPTKNYIVDGKMTRGFAFLAYPAQYAASGVMTVIVDQDGIIYQKDLGPNTTNLAKTLGVYDPTGLGKESNKRYSSI